MGAGSTSDAIRAALKQPGELNTRDTSNDILDHDPVSAFLRTMSADTDYGTPYGLIYRKWRNHPAAKNGWDQEPWGTSEDEQLVAELHDAEFWRLSGGAQRLAALAGAADAMKTGVTGMRSRLQDAWHGNAADAATGQFDALATALQAFHDTLSTVSTNLAAATGTSSPAVYSLGWNDDGTSAFSAAGPDLTTIADPSTQIDRINYRLYTDHSYTIEQLKQPSTCDLNEGAGMVSDTWWSDETLRGLDKLGDQYNAAVRWFRERLRAVHKSVGDAWKQLDRQLTALRDTGDIDPFGKLAMPTGDPGDGKDHGEHGRPPGTEQPPPGTVPDPLKPDGGETVTTTDQSRTPDQGSFNGDLSGKDDQQVVIHDGSTTITAGRDGGDGSLSLTVDDGTGHPTHYDVDFDSGTAEPGDPGTGDQSGIADTSGANTPAAHHPGTPAGTGASSSGGGGDHGSGGGAGDGGAGSGGASPGTSGQESAPQPGAVTGASPQSGPDQGAHPGGATPAAAASAAPGGGMGGGMGGGGMPMMGGGMGGGGQGGGGDSERTASQWRTEGNLFLDADPAERFDGVIGDDAPHLT